MGLEAETRVTENRSEPFVGRWHTLVSTTNWEKGRIILQWRHSLIDVAAAQSQYGDEQWSRMVGGVTPQHVGRLRRVYERFHDVYESYGGLYWSHFHAAFDWEDAEMWLEGAVQSRWSVSQMRQRRRETLGGIPDRDDEVPSLEGDVDEDFSSEEEHGVDVAALSPAAEDDGRPGDVVPSSVETVDNVGRQNSAATADHAEDSSAAAAMDHEHKDVATATPSPVPPFAELPELPGDVTEALDALKLAILRHKMAGWQEVSRDDVLTCLDGLRQLTLAPSDTTATAG